MKLNPGLMADDFADATQRPNPDSPSPGGSLLAVAARDEHRIAVALDYVTQSSYLGG